MDLLGRERRNRHGFWHRLRCRAHRAVGIHPKIGSCGFTAFELKWTSTGWSWQGLSEWHHSRAPIPISGFQGPEMDLAGRRWLWAGWLWAGWLSLAVVRPPPTAHCPLPPGHHSIVPPAPGPSLPCAPVRFRTRHINRSVVQPSLWNR